MKKKMSVNTQTESVNQVPNERYKLCTGWSFLVSCIMLSAPNYQIVTISSLVMLIKLL